MHYTLVCYSFIEIQIECIILLFVLRSWLKYSIPTVIKGEEKSKLLWPKRAKIIPLASLLTTLVGFKSFPAVK